MDNGVPCVAAALAGTFLSLCISCGQAVCIFIFEKTLQRVYSLGEGLVGLGSGSSEGPSRGVCVCVRERERERRKAQPIVVPVLGHGHDLL